MSLLWRYRKLPGCDLQTKVSYVARLFIINFDMFVCLFVCFVSARITKTTNAPNGLIFYTRNGILVARSSSKKDDPDLNTDWNPDRNPDLDSIIY